MATPEDLRLTLLASMANNVSHVKRAAGRLARFDPLTSAPVLSEVAAGAHLRARRADGTTNPNDQLANEGCDRAYLHPQGRRRDPSVARHRRHRRRARPAG